MSQTEVQLIKSNSVVDGDIVGMSSSKLSGALPAISGASLTNLPAGGLFSSYALLANVHTASSANLGAFTSGDWRTRDINTKLADPDSIVTLSSNQFTLQAGSYLIKYTCVAYGINRHAVRLRNITDSSSAGQVLAIYLNAGVKDMFPTMGAARVVISGAKVFEIQGQAETTKSDNGFGFTMITGPSETVQVEIFKET